MLLHQVRPAWKAWFGLDPEVTPELRAQVEATIPKTTDVAANRCSVRLVIVGVVSGFSRTADVVSGFSRTADVVSGFSRTKLQRTRHRFCS